MKISKILDMLKKVKMTGIAAIGGLLGAWAGAEGTKKLWRRLGIPLFLTILALLYLKDWRCIGVMLMMIPLSIGYGIPWGTPEYGDEGSFLGRLWFKIMKKDIVIASKDTINRINIYVRVTVGYIIAKSLIWIPIIKGNWMTYILCGLGIILVNGSISWRDLGTFKFRGKDLLWSEFWTYSLICLLASVMIYR